jgi:hypothetical protein
MTLTRSCAALRGAEAYAKLGITEIQAMPDRNPVEYVEALADRIVPRLTEV